MSQSIQVSFVQEGDVYTVHTGSSVLKDIVMDYTGVPETERGGNSSTLLIAAALSCFCGSIRAALVARGVPFRAIRAQGTGTKEPNADGAMRHWYRRDCRRGRSLRRQGGPLREDRQKLSYYGVHF